MSHPNRSYRQENSPKKGKKRVEFIILAMLLIPLAGSSLFLLKNSTAMGSSKPSGTILGQQLLQGELSAQTGVPKQALPSRFKVKGTVDDRYTLATDPETGETLINDSLGSIGTNNTSIDGDRAKLAQDMVALEDYLKSNRNKLSDDAYNWLKKVARTGMKLAFGTPGLPPGLQPAIKSDLLAQFHDISSNPTDSILKSGKYLELETMFQRPEEAYMAQGSAQDNTNFLKIDPLSPTLASTTPYLDSALLTNKLYLSVLEPPLEQLSPNGTYDYTSATTIQTTTVKTLTTTSSTGILSPTYTSSSTVTSSNIAPTPTTTTTSSSSPTVADYYNSTLGITATPTTSSTSNYSPSAGTTLNTTTTAPSLTNTTTSTTTTTFFNTLSADSITQPTDTGTNASP